MKLYHYASQTYMTLKTLEAQGRVTPEDREKALVSAKNFKTTMGAIKPGAYYQHISFFFEPIPLDIPKYFPKDHPVWFKGNALVEHVVETSSIKPFGYEVVEFPEKRELYLDDSVSTEEYHEAMRGIYKASKYIGFGESELSQVAEEKKLVGILEDSFLKLSQSPGFKTGDSRHKYAPLVTHVMLYPEGGTVKPVSVKKIRLK